MYEVRLDTTKLPPGVRLPLFVRATDRVGLSNVPEPVWLDSAPALAKNGIRGKVFLNGPAGPNGLYVGFTSDQGAVMPQQAIFIREGNTSGSFICPTAAVQESTTATISASALSSLKKVTLTVNPYFLTSFTGPSSIQQNAPGVASIVIDEPAPVGGLPVSFDAASSAIRIRQFIVIPAGKKSIKVNFRARAVTADTDVTITAKLAKASKSFTITVKK
jgi:hypothetical protein